MNPSRFGFAEAAVAFGGFAEPEGAPSEAEGTHPVVSVGQSPTGSKVGHLASAEGRRRPDCTGQQLCLTPNTARMSFSSSAAWLSTIAAPLSAKFGANLTLSRTGNTVCWGYGGQSAVIELAPDGKLLATFIDAESIDEVSACPAAAAYRVRSSYALNEASCSRMIADLAEFFSGVREPKFTFVDAYPR